MSQILYCCGAIRIAAECQVLPTVKLLFLLDNVLVQRGFREKAITELLKQIRLLVRTFSFGLQPIVKFWKALDLI